MQQQQQQQAVEEPRKQQFILCSLRQLSPHTSDPNIHAELSGTVAGVCAITPAH